MSTSESINDLAAAWERGDRTMEKCNHPYHVNTCKTCGGEFCYSCCRSTNVDQGGKHEPDYMLCPHCGADKYEDE